MWDDTAALEPFRRTQAPEWLTEPRIRRALRAGDLIALRRGVLVGRLASELAWHPHALATQAAIAGMRGGSPAVGCLGSAAVLPRGGVAPPRADAWDRRRCCTGWRGSANHPSECGSIASVAAHGATTRSLCSSV